MPVVGIKGPRPASTPAATSAIVVDSVMSGSICRSHRPGCVAIHLRCETLNGFGDLAEVIGALEAVGLFLGLGQCWKEHRGEDTDNGNHHQQLDQGERR